jgi:2'-5' RNA ligase
MAQQLSFPWFESETLRRQSLFFAVRPPQLAGRCIGQCAEEMRCRSGLSAKVRPVDRLHISLHAPSRSLVGPQAMATALKTAAEAAVLAMPAFALTLDHAMSFAGRQWSLVLLPRAGAGEAEIEILYRVLGHALLRAGLGRRLRPRFTPHLTLLYGERGIEEQPIDPITWLVAEFVLIHSVRGEGHKLLGQWALRG